MKPYSPISLAKTLLGSDRGGRLATISILNYVRKKGEESYRRLKEEESEEDSSDPLLEIGKSLLGVSGSGLTYKAVGRFAVRALVSPVITAAISAGGAVISILGTVVSMAASVTLSVSAAVASSIATIGAALSPYLLPAIAIGLVGYGAYRIYKKIFPGESSSPPATVESSPVLQKSPVQTAVVGQMSYKGPSAEIEAALAEAARISGMPLSILTAVAYKESTFNASAGASTSSAKGLFQFVSGTWREMVDKYGKAHGISIGDIFNPRANAIMGGLFLRSIYDFLKGRLGRDPSATDVYFGHFLGKTGAARFFAGLKDNPNQSGAKLMPTQARANKSVFFAKDGTERSLMDIYNMFHGTIASVESAVSSGKSGPSSVSIPKLAPVLAPPTQTAQKSTTVPSTETFKEPPAKITIPKQAPAQEQKSPEPARPAAAVSNTGSGKSVSKDTEFVKTKKGLLAIPTN